MISNEKNEIVSSIVLEKLLQTMMVAGDQDICAQCAITAQLFVFSFI